VEVSDTGIGISAEDLPFVFDRFWRSQSSRHIRCNGSGIGLAITKRLVEVMGGRIEVESTLGQGSIFRFCLPLACPTQQQIREQPESLPSEANDTDSGDED
jgi:signal transduction histidine kinase